MEENCDRHIYEVIRLQKKVKSIENEKISIQMVHDLREENKRLKEELKDTLRVKSRTIKRLKEEIEQLKKDWKMEFKRRVDCGNKLKLKT